MHKWLDFRYYFMELDRDWADGKYYSYKRRCIYFLEIVELENFKAITEGLYQSYSKEFPYSKKKDFIKLMFGNTISFLKRFLKLDLIRIGEIELGNESEYIFYMDADDINTEFSDFVIKSKYDIQHYRQYYKTVLKYLKFFKNDNAKLAILPHPINDKPKPELNEALILFSNTEIIESLYNELKGYFQGKEAELKKALQGKRPQEFLLFPHHQNKFVEVFKRLKYNGFLLSTPKETKDWICGTFTYQYQKGNKKEVRKFNTSTVHDILTKDKGEPTKKERICIVDWLPYKSHLTRQREAEKESI